MFIVGQPGCGKTTFIQNTDFSKYIMINSDNYRSFHKYSKEILEKYPTAYTKLTNFDAHLWGDELFSYAIQKGYSVLREKAPIDYSIVELLKKIPSNYNILINIVVAGNLASLLATRERYEKEVLENDSAKLSNIEAHNKCYTLLPDFILRCLSFRVKVNYIVFINKQYKIISANKEDLNILQNLRNKSNEQACLYYDTRINNIKKAMIKRNAPQEQFDELKKIEDIYSEIINVNKGYH